MIALSGGGTGGHLASLRVLKKAFMEQGVDSILIGSTYGQDSHWFAGEEGFAARYFLDTRGVMGRGFFNKIISLSMVIMGVIKSIHILRRHKVKAVLSVGGYAAAAASFASVILRIPFFIHEHNTVAGQLHRLLSPFARVIFNSYEERSPVRDYPVDEAFFDKRRLRKRVNRILFLGGSQGAEFINNFALEVAPLLHQRGIEIAHQTGEREFDYLKDRYRALNSNADIFPFEQDMAIRMAEADFAVTRAGAGTLWELAANGLPALFVPYPYAVRDHQYQNAKFFADMGLGFLIRESSLKPEILFSALNGEISEISNRLMKLIHPGGADKMAAYVLKSIGI
ncbi:MAG: UDP-N-acetylglucosamine--N-acetylmuramyl-(pentapeptide) pyrophosphoryl-undecaprenol N-acetylglucosamine transferase [Pseudomonadota bacterium]